MVVLTVGMVEVRGLEPLRLAFRGPPLHLDTPTERRRWDLNPSVTASCTVKDGIAISPQRAVSTPVRIYRLVPTDGCRPSCLLSHPRCPKHKFVTHAALGLTYMPSPHKTRHFCFNRYFWCKAVLSMTSIEEGESRRIRWRKAFAPTEGRRL